MGAAFPVEARTAQLIALPQEPLEQLAPFRPNSKIAIIVEEPIWDRFKIIAAKRGMTIGAPAR
jgi:hypothetical protein